VHEVVTQSVTRNDFFFYLNTKKRNSLAFSEKKKKCTDGHGVGLDRRHEGVQCTARFSTQPATVDRQLLQINLQMIGGGEYVLFQRRGQRAQVTASPKSNQSTVRTSTLPMNLH